MSIIRPRLNDFYKIGILQEKTDFAIPFLDEDLPLYVDPFLLWKSPSQQDQTLHLGLITAFRSILNMENSKAISALQTISECNEVGLGGSAKKRGHKIGESLAQKIIENYGYIKKSVGREIQHLEEIQLMTDQIGKDRISDFTCSILKSFLIDFTIDQSKKTGLPLTDITLTDVYDLRKEVLIEVNVALPINPIDQKPILLVPKRWLRYSPWINYEDYFEHHYLKEYAEEGVEPPNRFDVLHYNRENYDLVVQYIQKKEKTYEDCKNDPLFKAIPILSAKRTLNEIKKLPTGKSDNSDKKYEDHMCKLLPSLLYPHLDFAQEQSRTESGTLIRDLIFYNNRSSNVLAEFWEKFSCHQLVFELKNVKELDRDHLNQLNRYLNQSFGSVGILVTRNAPPKNIIKNIIDLWSGQRKCILVLTDEDIELMVTVFESKQRDPIEILNMKYSEFVRSCPS